MAWEDSTTFDAISFQFNFKEKEVIQLMRSNLKTSSFKMGRKRVSGTKAKQVSLFRRQGLSHKTKSEN